MARLTDFGTFANASYRKDRPAMLSTGMLAEMGNDRISVRL
jgi:hypothetical protein